MRLRHAAALRRTNAILLPRTGAVICSGVPHFLGELLITVNHSGAALDPCLLVYPGHYERRLVSRNGGVRWSTRWVNVSHLFAELEIGFEKSMTSCGTSTSDRCG